MNTEPFYPKKQDLWTKNHFLISTANLFLYVSMYMLIPALLMWMQSDRVYSDGEIYTVVVLFGVGLFLPGVFNSFLIDHFKRKNVYTWSLLGLIGTTYLFSMATSFAHVATLRLLQGVFFSLGSMTLGSTLAIDATSSSSRSGACISCAWSGRIGMFLGIAAGMYLFRNNDFLTVAYGSMLCCLLSLIQVSFIKLAFRAPLEPSIVSLDRFLLPRALYPAVILLPFAVTLGIITAHVFSECFYFMMFIGGVLALVIYRMTIHRYSIQTLMLLGILSLLSGSSMMLLGNNPFNEWGTSVLIGTGIALAASCIYLIMIKVPMHCERGTSNNTYQLFWEIGILAGILIDSAYNLSNSMVYITSLCLCALVILIYELSLHKWYNKQLKNNH